MPQENAAYWQAKFARNVSRDERVQRELRDIGWQVVVLWTCQLAADLTSLLEMLNTARSAQTRDDQ